MKRITAISLAIGLLATTAAHAHVSIASGPAFANASQDVAFGIGHGCAGADTYTVKVAIPAGVTSIRPMTSDFGKASVEKDAAGTITAVIWQKADADVLPDDSQYYKVIVRFKAPDKPFSTLAFPVTQTCKDKDGKTTVVEWNGSKADEPAPLLTILPARLPGWNSYTVKDAISDLSVYFKDAAIVWKDKAAYSFNAATTALIKATPGVTALTTLSANDTIWVKY